MSDNISNTAHILSRNFVLYPNPPWLDLVTDYHGVRKARTKCGSRPQLYTAKRSRKHASDREKATILDILKRTEIGYWSKLSEIASKTDSSLEREIPVKDLQETVSTHVGSVIALSEFIQTYEGLQTSTIFFGSAYILTALSHPIS